MVNGKHGDCAELARQAVSDIQSSKTPTSVIVRKLELIAELTGDQDLILWCEFQLGKYTGSLPLMDKSETAEAYGKRLVLSVLNANLGGIYSSICQRYHEAGGGFDSIEVIEEIVADFQRKKLGNSGNLYLHNMLSTISNVRNEAAKRAAKLYCIYSFGDIPRQVFDSIRERVDNLLLDICPASVEKFMSAYNSLASGSEEDWSLALTSCRRVIKAVADALLPPSDSKRDGRSLGEDQYVNRLWAFLDENAQSGSEKVLAKAHIDYLGSFLQKLNDKACKGVHSSVRYEEAAKAVLYTYLTLGDILEYANNGVVNSLKNNKGLTNVNSADIASLLAAGLTSEQAKAIVKRRSKGAITSLEELSAIKGIGPAKLEKLRATFVALPLV